MATLLEGDSLTDHLTEHTRTNTSQPGRGPGTAVGDEWHVLQILWSRKDISTQRGGPWVCAVSALLFKQILTYFANGFSLYWFNYYTFLYILVCCLYGFHCFANVILYHTKMKACHRSWTNVRYLFLKSFRFIYYYQGKAASAKYIFSLHNFFEKL